MADPEHLGIARKGREAWNKWRQHNPEVEVDFSDVDFTLEDIDFDGFEFGDNAKFDGATFGDDAQFTDATFDEVIL